MNKTQKPLYAKVIEIVLTIGTIIALFLGLFFLAEFRSDYKYHNVSPYGEATFEYALKDGEYARLAGYVKETEVKGPPPTSIIKYFGVGRYFYDSSMVNLAEVMGDEKLKSYWEEQKASAKAQCTGSMEENVILIDQQLSRY